VSAGASGPRAAYSWVVSRRSCLSGFSTLVLLLASLVGVELRPPPDAPGQWRCDHHVVVPSAPASLGRAGADTRHAARLPHVAGDAAALVALPVLFPAFAIGSAFAFDPSDPGGARCPGGAWVRGPPGRG
jgi:hypothetical protein